MITLTFHKELYDGFALDEALKVYERFGTLERAEEEGRWVIRVTATSAPREERLARELSNYALGLTIERGGQARKGGTL
ncbi:MAG: HxsD-like protein [Myxococcales bacterium]|nr:HxsD-like protein [Polyangiaceae bacterium]MDW8252047.1 HxsD-like protein [Myxococcales bacterium]